MAPFGKQQEILRLLPEWPKAQLAAMVAVTKLEEQASDANLLTPPHARQIAGIARS